MAASSSRSGSWPEIPDIPGKELAITSTEALSLESLPRRVLVLGGGYIGVELAGVFRSLGAEVTLVIRGSEVLRGFDEDVRAFLTKSLQARGIQIRIDSGLTSLERTEPGGPISAMLAMGEIVEADVVLFATGRAPNTCGLGLEEAGVTLGPRGAVAVNELGASSVPSIHAVGDCTDRVNLTPVAIGEGRALVDTLFRDAPTPVDHANVPSAVFSQPSVSVVGLSEDAARAKGIALDIYRTSFRPMKHTLSVRDERMLMNLVVERATDRVLGAHMVGADAPEIIQGLAGIDALNVAVIFQLRRNKQGWHRSHTAIFHLIGIPGYGRTFEITICSGARQDARAALPLG